MKALLGFLVGFIGAPLLLAIVILLLVWLIS
jgi:hypothetical protein